MPLPTYTKILELSDVKIAPLTDDPAGGSPTYGSLVDVPGVIKLGVKPTMTNKELRGDNKLLDIWSKVERIEWSLENAKLPLDVLKIMMGGTVTAAGTSPDQTQTYELLGADTPGYFKLEGKADYTEDGTGDVHVVFHKCKATEPPNFEITGEEFANVSASGIAIPLESNDKLLTVVINETAADIA